jgi:hypothetical protein
MTSQVQASSIGPSSAPPTIPSDDHDEETYNVRSEERTALLSQLQDLIGDVPRPF